MIDAQLERARGLSEAGAHDQALALLDETLRCAGAAGDARLHAARGWALENLDTSQLPEARSAYQAALALDGGDLWSRLGLATVLGPLGHVDAASELYRALIDQASPRAVAESEFFELIGWCQYRLGWLDGAVASFERALRVNAQWASVHFDLGLVLMLRGNASGAQAHYRMGLASSTGRGTLKVALDDLDDARRVGPALACDDAANELRAWLVQALANTDLPEAARRGEGACHG